MSENHYLNAFLEERLPELGLDFETYSSYLTGLVDDDEEAEWDDIMQLLQASSESHADDTEVWVELKTELLRLQKEQDDIEKQKLQELKQSKLHEEQERLQKDIALAKQAEEMALEKGEQKKELDAATRALVERFAYDESEGYDRDGKLVSAAGEEEKVLTNKEIAQQANLEKAQALRQQQTGGKKVEQQKTAAAKKEKIQMKEERRNRSTKGERKR